MSNLIWRITDVNYADSVFSGKGAQDYGGRWNSIGQPVVYTAATLSLAILETLVHTKIRQLPYVQFVAASAELPDELLIKSYAVNQLPADWRASSCPSLCDMGDQWLISASTAVLAVPSVVVPQEMNYLLNPNHPDFAALTMGSPEPLTLDQRLWE